MDERWWLRTTAGKPARYSGTSNRAADTYSRPIRDSTAMDRGYAFPVCTAGAGLQPPLVNPYPNKRKCVEEWAEAEEFCRKMEGEGKLVPGPRGKRTRGYSGFGKDYNSCVLGQVSEECGGYPTA